MENVESDLYARISGSDFIVFDAHAGAGEVLIDIFQRRMERAREAVSGYTPFDVLRYTSTLYGIGETDSGCTHCRLNLYNAIAEYIKEDGFRNLLKFILDKNIIYHDGTESMYGKFIGIYDWSIVGLTIHYSIHPLKDYLGHIQLLSA